jgi:hypothetical protein
MSHKIVENVMQEALKLKKNLLITGPHGVGKTDMIKDHFSREYGDEWAYFSGATMDAFVDFIGCPEKVTAEDGKKFLDMVRPKRFAFHKVRAIFMDEYNRAPKHVRNALMELIQFGSINGEPFPELETIWAAVNPSDDEYDVEEIDPAQLDRFHYHVYLDSVPSETYFIKKYGSDAGKACVEWWRSLPAENKKFVSPRRLDYAVDIYLNGKGNIRFVLDRRVKPEGLIKALGEESIIVKLKSIKNKCDSSKKKGKDQYQELENFLADEENFHKCEEFMTKEENVLVYIDYFPLEKIGSFITKNGNARELYMKMMENDGFSSNLSEVIITQWESGLNEAIKKQFSEDEILSIKDQLAAIMEGVLE